ncbi:MAG: metalloregulator ArsR/SmtB family transcription factor [Pseudomonadota bacterium]|nr:metalloregulator ArsR/SmtB family transcription factor [Pseudomonadota bacterium]
MTSPVFDRLTALSEPIRVRLLRVLAREELAVGEVARVLQTSQPTVSRHLKQLDEGGWVLRRKVGTASYFRLAYTDLDPEARMLWDLVYAQVEAEACDPASQYAEDLRRLDGVLAQRTGDSEELFRRLGGRWDTVRKELFGEGYVLPALLALLPPGQVMADLGCGTGAMLPLLAPVATQVFGVDREAAMLEVAEERTAELGNVTLCRGLLDALPLGDASVDLALCQLVLHHVRELPPVYAEVARVLAPGGRWVILDMIEHDRDEYRETMGHQHLGFSEATVRALAGDAGLAVRAWRVLPPDPAAQGPALFVAVLVK